MKKQRKHMPSPNFSPQLRDKTWEWPGDEAMHVLSVLCELHNIQLLNLH